ELEPICSGDGVQVDALDGVIEARPSGNGQQRRVADPQFGNTARVPSEGDSAMIRADFELIKGTFERCSLPGGQVAGDAWNQHQVHAPLPHAIDLDGRQLRERALDPAGWRDSRHDQRFSLRGDRGYRNRIEPGRYCRWRGASG